MKKAIPITCLTVVMIWNLEMAQKEKELRNELMDMKLAVQKGFKDFEQRVMVQIAAQTDFLSEWKKRMEKSGREG